MLNRKSPSDGRSLLVRRVPIELVLYEDGVTPLSVILPPYEDLREIESLKGTNFSIHQHAELLSVQLRAAFAMEQAKLEAKMHRFRESPTYLTRLAALSAHAQDSEKEERYLQELRKVDASEFALNRWGDFFANHGRLLEAEGFFQSLDLSKNVHANLRLASFYVQRSDIQGAVLHVERALSIEPFDYSARLFDGMLRIFLGEYERAISSFRIAAEERPSSSIVHTNMAIAYIRMGKAERAMVCLKKAVALDPLNATAVSLLSDIANTLEVSEEAVPSLRYFVRFEQKHAAMWAKLARALIQIQDYGEAVAALKRQSSVEDAPDLWNNMGVAHYLKGDRAKAADAFVHAMRLSNDPTKYTFCIAAKNACALLLKAGQLEQVLHLVDSVMVDENRSLILSREDLSQLISIKIEALNRLQRTDLANDLAEQVLKLDEANMELKGWIASGLLTQYSLREDRRENAISLAKEWYILADRLEKRKQRVEILNNLAFFFIEIGSLDEGERALSKISFAIHKDPYPTATLGLLHFRRGHPEKAEALYAEAMNLCNTHKDRVRIRQKLNLEEAAMLIEDQPKRAFKLLQKVWSEKDGEPLLASKAASILGSLGVFSEGRLRN